MTLLPHKDATANLSIDGLAICCFNSDRTPKRWEVGFLRHPAHHLTISAVRGSGTPKTYPIDPAALKIEFKTVNGRTPDYGHFKDGFFDVEKLDRPKRKQKPADDDHKENFRWTLDLDDNNDVGHGRIKRLRRPIYGATVAYIYDALFYTLNQTPTSLYLVPEGEDPRILSQSELDKLELGMTNDQLGADITCKAGGEVAIVVDGVVIAHLDHKDGEPWRVCLMNMRHHQMRDHETERARTPSDLEAGDFQLYYAAIETTKPHSVIWGYPTKPQPTDCDMFTPRSGRTDCDTVRVGDDVENLDPLLT